jgi:hypothetical protein
MLLLPQAMQVSVHQLSALQRQQQQDRSVRQRSGSQQQQQLRSDDFAAAAVPLTSPQHNRAVLGRCGSGTPGGGPSMTSSALDGGGISISGVPCVSSVHHG